MSKGWKIVGAIVLVLILMGAICIGVGFMTGGNLTDIFSLMDTRYNLTGHWDAWSQWAETTFNNVVGGLQQLW